MHVFERVGVDHSVGVASSSYDVGVSHTGGGLFFDVGVQTPLRTSNMTSDIIK